jgi:hypothetical protein
VFVPFSKVQLLPFVVAKHCPSALHGLPRSRAINGSQRSNNETYELCILYLYFAQVICARSYASPGKRRTRRNTSTRPGIGK